MVEIRIRPYARALEATHAREQAPFDASRIFEGEPLPPKVATEFRDAIKGAGYLDIEMLLNQTTTQLNKLVLDSNYRAWGYHDPDLGAPSTEDAEAVEQLIADTTGLATLAREAQHLRAFAEKLSQALEVAREQAMADAHARSDAMHEAALRAQFEASEAEAEERRFQEWRSRQPAR